MVPNPFSVNSLLNSTAQNSHERETSQGAATESSGLGTASSVGSPLVDLVTDGTISPASVSSSPRRALRSPPRHSAGRSPQAPGHFVSLPPVTLVAATANGSSLQTPVGAVQHILTPQTPAATSLQQHYRHRDYRHHLYRHQPRTIHDAPLQSPPPVANPNGPQPCEFQHRHTQPAVDYRFWPYPPPPPHIAARAPPAPAAQYYASAGAQLPGANTPWRRERRSKACLRCHTKKIKCEGDGPECDGCRQAGCECKWVEMKKRGPKPKKKREPAEKPSGVQPAASENGILANTRSASPATKPPGSQSEPKLAAEPGAPKAAPPPASTPAQPESSELDAETATMEQVLQRFQSDHVDTETREAVVYFFDYLYGRIPVFHPASFVRRVAFGQVDQLLIDVMKACTGRLVTKRTGRHVDVAELTRSVHRRLLAGLDHPTTDYVRAVLLAASQTGGESRFMTYNSLASLAASVVMRLGWHTLDLGGKGDGVSWAEWVQLEEKRRTFWAVYQLDSYQSLMADRPMTIDRSRICVATPGSDTTWDDVTMPQIMHWPTRHQPDMSHDVMVRMGALSYAFVELCSLLALVSQINDFLWSVRVDVLVLQPGREWATDVPFMPPLPEPALGASRVPVKSMFEYPEFRRLHESLCKWRDQLVRSEDMRSSSCAPIKSIAQMGSLENRRFTMRVRFFSMRCYFTAFFLMLHGTNRPSFFDPDRQLPKRMGGLVAAVSIADSEEDRVLRSLMSTAFSELLNDGFLAYDVVDESWELCMREVYLLMAHLDHNSDIPIDRCDSSISFCLFTCITVLVRNFRMCREQLARGPNPKVQDEMARSAQTLRRMWKMLKDLGFIWGAKGMEKLLQTMQVDEIANAADMFNELSL
ncbi:hypothetical protein EV183_000454 [Coemansia sp. RSA 2336]|nr:hypothetical protein EV183_000454 [Coemansia sp. RSA 2336]